ncbi:MAG TPA: branched-chain amino acid ABC transporter permease [Anaerolineales bacterium]|nr:branched-chain amino acid ABC transporter permease [Anaerolineales bacterium]
MNRTFPARTLVQRNTTPILLAALLLFITIVAEMLGINLIVRIVTVMFTSLILVLGLQLFMGNSGILSFAHIGFMGIGAYASVLFSMTPQAKQLSIPSLYPLLVPIHLPFWAAVLMGALVAALVAAVVSYPLMRLSDAAAVITTFALLVIIHVILVHWDRITNGPRTLFGVDNYTDLWTSALVSMLAIFLVYFFKESRVGLRLRATRDDAYAAASIGINMVSMRWLAFTASAFLAGLGGGLWAHFITSFSPYAFYLTETFVILAMLVVGGPYSVSGAVVGTLVVTAVREGLRGIENYLNIAQVFPQGVYGFTEVVLSIALILILIYRPSGIMGSRELRWTGFGRMKNAPEEALQAAEDAKETSAKGTSAKETSAKGASHV